MGLLSLPSAVPFFAAGFGSAEKPDAKGHKSVSESWETAGRGRPFVLMVEDNQGDVLLVKEALREHNVDVPLVVSSDGDQAVRLIEQLDASPDSPCPSVVVLDLNLPRTNGHEVLTRLRRSTRCAGVHVIVFSSSNAVRDRSAAMREGATEYFAKPNSLDSFLDIGRMIADALAKSDG